MKVIPFDEQPLEARCLALDGLSMDHKVYLGQDSVVFRNNQTDRAIHIYNKSISFIRVLTYVQCVNAAASCLDRSPFIEDIEPEIIPYKVEVRVNLVEECGENLFSIKGNSMKYIYTISPFIDGSSLCWSN